jgi:hypothetical protein
VCSFNKTPTLLLPYRSSRHNRKLQKDEMKSN